MSIICLTCEKVDRSNESKSELRAHWCVVLVRVVKTMSLIWVGRSPVAEANEAQKEDGCYHVKREICLTICLEFVPLVGNKIRPPH